MPFGHAFMFAYIGQKTVSQIMHTIYLWVHTEDEMRVWQSRMSITNLLKSLLYI